MRIREGSGGSATYHPYVQFNVSGVGAAQVASVKLRLFVTTGTADGGTVYRHGAWLE